MQKALFAALAVSVLACSPDNDKPTAKASASAASAAPKVDLGSYCEKVCKRSTACGLEAAEGLAKGHAHELTMVEQLRKDAPKTEASCTEACRASKVTPEDEPALARAQSCLEQTSCQTFDSCLAQAGKTKDGS